MARRILVFVALACVLPSCLSVSYRDPRKVHSVYEKAEGRMHGYIAAGQYVPAARIARVLDRLQPSERNLAMVLEAADEPDVTRLFEDSSLGRNLAWRLPEDNPWWERALWYIPDRVLDLLDVVSFDVGVGPGLWADVHVTRGFMIAAGSRANLGVGWHPGRNLGVQITQEQGVLVLGPGTQTVFGFQKTGYDRSAGSQDIEGMHFSTEPLYQDFRDYWAIGAGAQLLLVGASVDVHVLQLADFFAGFVLVDFLNDDLATTVGQPLDGESVDTLERLYEILLDERSMRDYHNWIAAGMPTDLADMPKRMPGVPEPLPDDARQAETDLDGAQGLDDGEPPADDDGDTPRG